MSNETEGSSSIDMKMRSCKMSALVVVLCK